MSNTTDVFNEFAPAYTISNENQRWATSAVSNTHHVLTVAGSGDQALFYHLSGSKQVDTFDRTRNAKVIQDIKFVAAKTISYQEYSNLLLDLFYYNNINKIPTMQKLLPLLPQDTIRIINTPGNKYIFGAGLDARNYPENIPSPEEYETLQKTLNKPFKFIRCDLSELHTQISDKYDLINISNIFDYGYDIKPQANILYRLAQHLNVGGHIVYLPQNANPNYNGFRLISDTCALEYTRTLKHSQSQMVLFQRTR